MSPRQLPHSRSALTIITICLISGLAGSSVAEWSHDAMINNRVSPEAFNVGAPQATSDGAGGALVVFLENDEPGTILYVQRLDADGQPQWGPDAVVAMTGYGYGTSNHHIVADGAGGAFIVQEDSDDELYYHLFIQHVDASGTVLWDPAGMRLSPLSIAGDVSGRMVADGTGGVYVTWTDFRGADGDIYAQHFSAGGGRLWGEGGLPVSTYVENQRYAVVAADPTGGFYVAWRDSRNTATSGDDIYAARVGSDGSLPWTTDGVPVCTATLTQYAPRITPDGMGSVVIAWYDLRDSATNSTDIYAQRMTISGGRMWGSWGRAVVTMDSYQESVVLTGDGNGGAVMAWIDNRVDSYDGTTIYAQAMSGDGYPRWTDNGIVVGVSDGTQSNPQICVTTDGQFAVTWTDLRDGNYDVYGQKLSLSGSRLWSYYGTPIGVAAWEQTNPVVVPDAKGGAVALWLDARYYVRSEVYAQRVDRLGYLGDPAPRLTGLNDYPFDQGGIVVLDWNRSWLDDYGELGISRYSVWRRYLGAKSGAESPAPVAPISPDALDKAGWSYIGEVLPRWFAEYSYDAPTYADSTAAGIPVTEFMVLAEVGSSYIESNAMGGWSVDNLSPGAPLELLAAGVALDAVLTWKPSGVDDEDLLHYNIYRSLTPEFTPEPASFLASAADTNYVDQALPAGTWYYKVTGVDIHGNEGDPSNESWLTSVSAVGDGGIPTAVLVRGAYPNPFNPTTEVKYGLPHDGRARLSVYDVQGRLVRVLVDGPQTAGYHTVPWDGRDTNGRSVASGVYIGRLEAAGAEARLKLVLSK